MVHSHTSAMKGHVSSLSSCVARGGAGQEGVQDNAPELKKGLRDQA